MNSNPESTYLGVLIAHYGARSVTSVIKILKVGLINIDGAIL